MDTRVTRGVGAEHTRRPSYKLDHSRSHRTSRHRLLQEEGADKSNQENGDNGGEVFQFPGHPQGVNLSPWKEQGQENYERDSRELQLQLPGFAEERGFPETSRTRIGQPVSRLHDLQFSEEITTALHSLGLLTTPTRGQMRGVETWRRGGDVIAIAPSGPVRADMASALLAETALATEPGEMAALMLTPTKSVAKQTAQTASDILALALKARTLPIYQTPASMARTSRFAADVLTGTTGAKSGEDPPSVALVIGGVPLNRQEKALQGARVGIGTFERVSALVQNGMMPAQHIRLLILDEPGSLFEQDAGTVQSKATRRIFEHLPLQRQTLSFATAFSRRVCEKMRLHMRVVQMIGLKKEDRTDDGNTQRTQKNSDGVSQACQIPKHSRGVRKRSSKHKNDFAIFSRMKPNRAGFGNTRSPLSAAAPSTQNNKMD